MNCDRYQISCQLDRIADELTGFDFEGFMSTLIATVIGAVLALLGAWWLDKGRAKDEAKERYEQRLDDALYRFLEEIGERIHVLATANSSLIPPPATLHAAANMARMVARGADADATKQMQYAADRIAKMEPGSDQQRQLQIVEQVIRAWREGSHDAVKAKERFEGLAL